MEIFQPFIDKIDDPAKKERVVEVLQSIHERYPDLGMRLAWNQPVFTDHDTFIIAFSLAKKHMAVSPEKAGLRKFAKEIEEAGYEATQEMFRIPWNAEVDYPLLFDMVEFNVEDKKDCTTFWRK